MAPNKRHSRSGRRRGPLIGEEVIASAEETVNEPTSEVDAIDEHRSDDPRS